MAGFELCVGAAFYDPAPFEDEDLVHSFHANGLWVMASMEWPGVEL
jgi:hypothetical protein